MHNTASRSSDPGRPYTVPEAAEYLRVSTRTVYQEIRDGKLNATKIRNRRIIWQSQLDEYARSLIANCANPNLLRRRKNQN